MAVTKALKLAKALLNPRNIHIAERIVQEHFDKAMSEKDKARLRELSEILSIVEDVKAEKES